MRLQYDKLLMCQIFFPTIFINVFLSITVTETILSQEDMPWEVLKRRGHESVRLMELTRFYLELHKDPHGPEVAMFIGNLPANLSQKQYETLLMEFSLTISPRTLEEPTTVLCGGEQIGCSGVLKLLH